MIRRSPSRNGPGGDVDAVALGGFVILFIEEEFLIDFFTGPEACADDLFLAGAVEADHLFSKVPDPDGFPHVQDEELPALGDGDHSFFADAHIAITRFGVFSLRKN